MEYINTPTSQAEQDQMLGYEPSPLYSGESADVTSAKKDWASAAQYYWARAFFLFSKGDFSGMATVVTQQAIKAEARANACELAIALAGGMTACKDADAVRQGKTLDAKEVAQAKAAVMAKAEAMGAFKTPADLRRERHEANKAETAKFREAEKSKAAAIDARITAEVEAAGLMVGQVHEVEFTYKQAKMGLVRINEIRVEVPLLWQIAERCERKAKIKITRVGAKPQGEIVREAA
jgi:hypothetical protein